MSYNRISQQLVSLFTSLCKLHQQQRSITSHCKKTISTPIQASGFLCHVEIDLIDFRKLPCNCSKHHNWVLHVQDHFSKYSWLLPVKHKETQEVASSLESVCWMFRLPTTLHSDKGMEFKSKMMTDFCAKYKIKQVFGAPRNPSTQGGKKTTNNDITVKKRTMLGKLELVKSVTPLEVRKKENEERSAECSRPANTSSKQREEVRSQSDTPAMKRCQSEASSPTPDVDLEDQTEDQKIAVATMLEKALFER